jgi:hypothetical protein
MAFQLPFQGASSGDSGAISPSEIARRRLLAQQLIGNKVQDAGPIGALANTLSGSLSGYENKQASEMQGQGEDQARALMAQVLSSDNPNMATLGNAAANPFLNENQSGLVNALLGQTMDRNDPANQLALRQAQLNYDQDLAGIDVASSLPSNVQEWEYYSALPPEQQSQYLTMKRSNSPLNIGTGFVTQDPANPGQIMGEEIAIDSFTPAQDASLGKVIGDAAATRILELPKVLAQSGNMVASIDGILNDPALDSSTGWLSFLQGVPGTEQYRFGQRALQLQGQAFLQAFESLKGGGQITEVEGVKATQAIGRLSTAQNPADYRDALNELKGIVQAARTRAEQSAGAVTLPPGSAIQPQGMPQQSAPQGGVTDWTDYFGGN